MADIFDNKVIIIGADHHNTLAVVRNLGSFKCNIEVLIHDNKKLSDICIAKSRYAKNKTFVVAPQENIILQWLLNHAETNKKTIIFPFNIASFLIIIILKEILNKNQFFVFTGKEY